MNALYLKVTKYRPSESHSVNIRSVLKIESLPKDQTKKVKYDMLSGPLKIQRCQCGAKVLIKIIVPDHLSTFK